MKSLVLLGVICLSLSAYATTTTTWTGVENTDWFNSNNWTAGVPNKGTDCTISTTANQPIIEEIQGGECNSVKVQNSATLTLVGAADLHVWGNLKNSGKIISLTPDGWVDFFDDGITATTQLVSSATPLNLNINKTAGGSLVTSGNLTLSQLVMFGGNYNFVISSGSTVSLPHGVTIDSGILEIDSGGIIQMGKDTTLLVSGGTLFTEGVSDDYPQDVTVKAQITNDGGDHRWAFKATSGTIDLTGFLIDWVDKDGLDISGTTNVNHLDGGQLRNLSMSPDLTAVQLNTSGKLPAIITNLGWNWGPVNAPPAPSVDYKLVSSSGCNNQTIVFDQWFGDFYSGLGNLNPQDKVKSKNCTILMPH